MMKLELWHNRDELLCWAEFPLHDLLNHPYGAQEGAEPSWVFVFMTHAFS